MSLRLPSRYEDLDLAFRGRLRPNQSLLDAAKGAFKAMEISGGIRFLPVFGASGSGKTSAALELATHLPELHVELLPREVIDAPSMLNSEIDKIKINANGKKIVAVIDQYEEVAAEKTSIPSKFVEALSILDRDRSRKDQVLFLWLTTSKTFQADLAKSTSRNQRILVSKDFEISSLEKENWPQIIQETFQFHNQEKSLSDYEVLEGDISELSQSSETLGFAIEKTGEKLAAYATTLHDLSNYLVVILWPVTDGLRISRLQQFTDPRQGYKLDWNSWYRQLNKEDQDQLPLREYNKARLYFDVRLIPIAAADLYPLCKDLDESDILLGQSYLGRFQKTHFYSVVSGNWSADSYAPLRERESKRADDARAWYPTVTQKPTQLGRRIAKCLEALGLPSDYEATISSPHSKIRADILIDRSPIRPSSVIVELKAFSAENTMPSTVASSVLTTLKRHAQFAGFLQRQ